MKMVLNACAAFAVLAAASPALAKGDQGGHWEWRARQTPGPRSPFPAPPVRVWVRDSAPAMAVRDCPPMTGSAVGCTSGLPGPHAPGSD
jgi:hypothetical protein